MAAVCSPICAPAIAQDRPWRPPKLLHPQHSSPLPPPPLEPLTDPSSPPPQETLPPNNGLQQAMDRDAISSILRRKELALPEGMHLHSCAVRSGLDADAFVANLLISMYGRCGKVEEAQHVFDRMPSRTMVSWSAMISACSKQEGHSQRRRSLILFEEMARAGFEPNNVVFVSVLAACGALESLGDARSLHSSLVESGICVDEVLGTAIVGMYGSCGDLEAANRIFNSMRARDTIAWNALISAYGSRGLSRDAAILFESMQEEEGIGVNKSTFVSFLAACANVCGGTDTGEGNCARGRNAHRSIVERGLDSDTELTNALIHMYAMAGALHDARWAFDAMEKHRRRDVVSWNSIISAYARKGQFVEAFAIFREMQAAGAKPTHVTFLHLLSSCTSAGALPVGKSIHLCITDTAYEDDVRVATALINMYGSCGSCEDARRVFGKVKRADLACWNAMIVCYVRQQEGERALGLFAKMREEELRLSPDETTFASITSACSATEDLPKGVLIHDQVVKHGFDSGTGVLHALIHMYGRCGKLDEARAVFDSIKPKDFLSWNVMIAAYAQQGHGTQAVDLYERMLAQNVKPNEVTFVSLLSACSHAGLVSEGYGYFVSMTEVHGLTQWLEHYVCVIDLLGRVGRLAEAEDLVRRMPYESTPAVWSALLGACKLHGDAERTKRIARELSELGKDDETSYVVL